MVLQKYPASLSCSYSKKLYFWLDQFLGRAPNITRLILSVAQKMGKNYHSYDLRNSSFARSNPSIKSFPAILSSSILDFIWKILELILKVTERKLLFKEILFPATFLN